MANDKITVTAGVDVAADKVGTKEFQVVKLDGGADGASAGIQGDTANGLDVDVTRLPALPAGTNSIGKVTIGEAYAPVGAHSSGATIASATTLTKPGGATQIILQALTQNVRFTLDGTDPTATLGFQLAAGNPPLIIAVPGASIKVIQETATASLQYQWIS